MNPEPGDPSSPSPPLPGSTDELLPLVYEELQRMAAQMPGQTLLATALVHEFLDRYRLKHHRYPSEASALVPDFLAKLPMDIDCLPPRMATSADGSSAVIYSVGWNLTDDWHGKLPGDYDETNYEKNADWAIALPFPPLPMP